MISRRHLFKLAAAAIGTACGIKGKVESGGLRRGKVDILVARKGVGSSLRGMRNNDIICDEFSSIPPGLFKEVSYKMSIDNKPESIWFTGNIKIWNND